MITPTLSIILSTPVSEQELLDFTTRLNRQTLRQWEVLALTNAPLEAEVTDSRIKFEPAQDFPTPEKVRTQLLSRVTGQFVAVMTPYDAFSSDRLLEIVLATAELREVDIAAVGVRAVKQGKSVVLLTVPSDCELHPEEKCFEEGLSGFFFRREWLLSQPELCFQSLDPAEDAAFLIKALVLAERFFVRAGVGVQRNTECTDTRTPTTVTKEKLLCISNLIPFAKRHHSLWLVEAQCEKLLLRNRAQIRALLDAMDAPRRAEISDLLMSIAREVEASEATSASIIREDLKKTYLQPQVTVIVPVYNTAKYLPRCLNSLRNQTLKNVEIICVNDGSPDNAAEVLQEWQAYMPNLVVLSQRNAGLSAARNAALKIAHGRYIGFVDSDDYVDTKMYQSMAAALEGNPKAELAMCGVSAIYTYDVDDFERKGLARYFSVPGEGLNALTPELIHSLNVSACCKLYRADFLRENAFWFPVGLQNEDEVFFFFVMSRAQYIYLFQEMWYFYPRTEDGIMAQQLSETAADKLPATLIAFETILRHLIAERAYFLYGVFFRHLCGSVNRYRASPAADICERAASLLLHRANFYHTRDLVLPKDKGYVLSRLQELFALDPTSVTIPPAQGICFPVPKKALAPTSKQPLLTYIVPVFNVDQYLIRCIESLRCQTYPNIEILCIDDGSWDDSPRILDNYKEMDPRIRVIHKSNSGVADSRNLGIQEARGKYLSFVDGDDWLSPTMAEETLRQAEQFQLEMCLFDFACFDWRTEAPVKHYWTLQTIQRFYPQGVFAGTDLKPLRVYGASWQWLYLRSFLVENKISFPKIKLSEDLVFVLQAVSMLQRGKVFPRVFYHYRRGNPSSAISRLSTSSTSAADNAQIQACESLIKLRQHLSSTHSPMLDAFIERCGIEVVYFAEHNALVRSWLLQGGWSQLGVECFSPQFLGEALYQRYLHVCQAEPEAETAQQTPLERVLAAQPPALRSRLETLMREREGTKKDLYLVTGQLNSVTNEPIDSWTFFSWLQKHHVPSKYVIWEKHPFYRHLLKTHQARDVIALKGDGCSNTEFLTACHAALARAKIVLQENGALHSGIRQWLLASDIDYAFLQHGLFFWAMDVRTATFLSSFNTINATSDREVTFFQEHIPANPILQEPPRYIVGGLPRWDLLKDESSQEQPIVFIMFTGRYSFKTAEAFQKSMYLQGIKALLSEENLARLQAQGIRVVLAPHHHLVNVIKGFDFKIEVTIASTHEISYWIRHASCCITDMSSVSFDFLFLNKPVIYWRLDKYDVTLHRDDFDRLRFAEHQMKQMFNDAQNATEVITMVERYAKTHFQLEPEKRAIAESFFTHKQHVCQHLYDALEANCVAVQQETDKE